MRKRARHSLYVPPLPAGWSPCVVTTVPDDFDLNFQMPSNEPGLLKHYNAHVRDGRITFHQADHRYEVDGRPTCGSVTSVVHAFTEDFDMDLAIDKMMNSSAWPRADYLRRDGQSMSRTEIKEAWRNNGRISANMGTWAHFLCESFLNRQICMSTCPEMDLFLQYAASLEGYAAFRTEWTIFGEDENLAGSIDFVAKKDDGTYLVVDWKRSKDLQRKYSNQFRNMKEPLDHLPDCKGIHYRLQVNIYRYLLQKYYGLEVSGMHVVCIHPDCGKQPFIDQVPVMQSEVQHLMSWQRRRAEQGL